MRYLSVSETARKWGMSERTVRNQCAVGKIRGTFLTGKTWNLPEDAARPCRTKEKAFSDNPLLNALKEQKDMQLKGGIYHRVQIDLTYNSNHIEGSRLTQDQTRFIFETHTIGASTDTINIDDVIETTNHFRCIDLIIEKAASKRLTETLIKELHLMLKSGTSDSRKEWLRVGEYKKLPNEVGGNETCPPAEVAARMRSLLADYNSQETKTLEDVVAFHREFECIHPFQDGNGRVGRLILFKECLSNRLVPFIIDEEHKLFYYRGLQEWDKAHKYLIDTCLSAQDNFKAILDYFKVEK